MAAVIKVEDISKIYRLGVVGTGTLSHDLNRWWHKARGKEDPYLRIGEENNREAKGGEYAWALKNINFEVEQGEVLGIVGKNGAGKSTLLKILSRVTQPTTGSVKVKGRIASLLEVGTGFHPELTGRENIFLNGAILGMSKAEVRSKFDEIVNFSGVERYIDTPVKRYSSGMYVRLAFAVAAHLEPEILVVDEVLAVGDAEFQKKCLGKMQDVAGQGRTVLFVSHNMAAVKNLCTKGIFLQQGKVIGKGTSEEIVSQYLQSNLKSSIQDLASRTDRTGSGLLKFTNIKFKNRKNELVNEVISGDFVQIILDYELKKELKPENIILAISVYDEYQEVVTSLISDELGIKLAEIKEKGEIIFEIPRLTLRGGRYFLRLFASYKDTSESNFLDNIYNAYVLDVLPGDFWSSGKINRPGSHMLMEGTILSK